MAYLVALVILFLSWISWWFVVPVGLAVGYFAKSFSQVVYSSFLAPTLVWMAVAYYWDVHSHGQVSSRLGNMLHLPHPVFVFVMVGVIGGLTGLLSATFTWSCQRMSQRSK